MVRSLWVFCCRACSGCRRCFAVGVEPSVAASRFCSLLGSCEPGVVRRELTWGGEEVEGRSGVWVGWGSGLVVVGVSGGVVG